MSSLVSVRTFCRRWAVQVRSNLIVGLVALVLLATGSAPAFGVDPPLVLLPEPGRAPDFCVAGDPPRGFPCLQFSQPGFTTVVGPVNVHLIFWVPDGYHFNPDDPTPEGDAAYQQKIEQFIRDLDGSEYYNIITQYYNPYPDSSIRYAPNRLTLVDSYAETIPFPSSPGDDCSAYPQATLCSSDVQSAVRSFWQKYGWPQLRSDLLITRKFTDVLLLYIPAGASVCSNTIGCSGERFSAYHFDVKPGSDNTLPWAIYGLMPALPGEAIGLYPPYPNGQYVDTAISLSAHELFEAVTDPIGFGWEAPWFIQGASLEVADICAWGPAVFGPTDPVSGANMILNGHPYRAQYMWSNAQRGCTHAFHGQFINFSALPDVPYGSPPFTVEADATSLLTVTFTANGACSVTPEGLVTLTTTGVCTITASQAGNQSSGGFYEPATPVVQSFDVTPGTPCAAGSYSTTGFAPCTPAPAGSYVPGAESTTATRCPAGTYQPNSGQTSCIPASPGHFVGSVGQTTQTSCLAGTYQPNSGQTSCLAADPGHFVALTEQTTQTACAPGSYQPNSGANSCILASPGYFVAASEAIAQVQCPAGFTSPAGATACNLLLFNFTGFFAPVDNPPVINTMKAGSAVPVKFSLGGNRGLAIFATGYPKSQVIACDSSSTDSIEETVTAAGGSTLTYDATTDQYKYVWKTDKAWKGCRQLLLQFTDGTTKSALFQLQ